MSHRYRVYPTTEQEVVFKRHCADARDVWNLALEQVNMYRPHWRPPGHAERNRQLAEARHGTYLGEGSSVVQQQALRDFNRAMQNWWGGSHGRPTRRRKYYNEGFGVVDLVVRQVNPRWGEVRIPKVGYARFKLSRPIPENIKSARISLDRSGRWHVTLVALQPPVVRVGTGKSIGLDLGVASTVTTPNGSVYNAPKSPKTEDNRKRRLQRQLARQVKGSNRYEQTRRSLAKLSARDADRRKDFIEKTTTELVIENDLIAIEDLSVKRMSESPSSDLNREIRAQGWGMIRKRLTDKASSATSPVEVIAVNPAYTSQRCSECGNTDKRNRKNQSDFKCISCGHTANADVNAAKNILAAGYAETGRGGTLQQEPVETSTQPVAA